MPDPLDPDQPLPNTARMTNSGGLWQPPSVEEAAQFFPQYEVLALIGRGGMGAVYQARQLALDRFVAIKLLPLEVSADPSFADRFVREARAMGKLNHPNIIAVYDFGQTTAGHLYFAMEFVDGTNLHQVIHGPGLQAAQALVVIGEVCDALAYAHGKGVVHRDMKPANVMLSSEGRVKVADFGLARLTDPGAENLGHTMTGTVMGTPDYMAPEQTRGMNVDHRADIYSLGVMLYEMLCGETPKGIFDPPSHRVPVDARVDDVVKKAMQSVPERRFQSSTEMKAAVDTIRTMPAPKRAAAPAPAPQSPAKSRTPLYAGIGIAAAIVIAVLVFASGGKKSKPVAAKPIAAATPRAATPAAATPSAAPIVKQMIDLLALTDPVQDRLTVPPVMGKNEWGREGAALVYKTDGKAGKVIAPVRFAASRGEIEISIRRTSGKGRLHVDIPLDGGRILPVYVDAPGMRIINNKDGPAWPASTPADGRITIRFERGKGGAGDRVEIQPEGASPLLWTGDMSKYKHVGLPEPHPAFPGEPVTSLFAHADGYEIRAWTLRVFEGEAKVLRGASAPATSAAPTTALTFAGHRYQVVADTGTWTTAKVRAEAMGGHLAVITSKEENDWIRSTFIERLDEGTMLWLGATNSGPDGNWKWVTGEELGFDGWASPNALRTKPRTGLGFVRSVGNKIGWAAWGMEDSEKSAERNRGFIVEWDAGAPSSSGVASSIVAATKDAPFVNSLGMKFVPVPGTKVLFSMWDTRVQDYAEFAKAEAGKNVDSLWKTQEQEGVPVGRSPDHPVVAVSWDDAQAFCAWLTAKEQTQGTLPPGAKYRLPSDEEWSWAVGLPPEAGATPEQKHGKNSADFPWGKVWPPPKNSGNYADETFHAKFPKPDPKNPRIANRWIEGYEDGYATTSPVGSFPANVHGLHDMGGNVWQWCEDWWNAQQTERVLRGNSFPESQRDRMLSSVRHHTAPGVRYGNHGFRCVLASSSSVASSPPVVAPAPTAVAWSAPSAFSDTRAEQVTKANRIDDGKRVKVLRDDIAVRK